MDRSKSGSRQLALVKRLLLLCCAAGMLLAIRATGTFALLKERTGFVVNQFSAVETEYSVTLELSGGTLDQGSQDRYTQTGYGEDHTFTLTVKDPAKDRYIFAGWAETADAAEAKYNTLDAVEITLPREEPSITLYALWEEDSRAYAVYSADDNSFEFFYGNDWPAVGEQSRTGKTAANVYLDVDTTDYSWYEGPVVKPSWNGVITKNVKTVRFVDSIAPISTSGWFYDFKALESVQGLENLDTSNVTDMSYMFRGCENLTALDVSGFNTQNTTTMRAMFAHCVKLTALDVEGPLFTTGAVRSMQTMFFNCPGLRTLDLSGFDTGNVSVMTEMFHGCKSLVEVTLSKDFRWVGTDGYLPMPGIDAVNYPESTGHWSVLGDEQNPMTPVQVAEFMEAAAQSYTFVPDIKPARAYAVYSAGDNSFEFFYGNDWPEVGEKSRTNKTASNVYLDVDVNDYGWYDTTPYKPEWNGVISSKVKTVTFVDEIHPISTSGWFRDFVALTTINGIANLHTEKVTDMAGMFSGCDLLASLDASHFVTSNVTDMRAVFQGCYKLKSLDLSSFDTAQVTGMNHMFNQCNSLTFLDVSSFDTSQVTSMAAMFQACYELPKLDVSRFHTEKVRDMSYMFVNLYKVTELDVSGFVTDNVETMRNMFAGDSALTKLDVSKWNTARVNTMQFMFNQCSGLTALDVSNWDTGRVTTLEATFNQCSSLTSLDVSNWDTSDVKSMRGTFSECASLTALDTSNWDTRNVTTMESAFYKCTSLTALDTSNWNTSGVTTMAHAFNGCTSLTTVGDTNFNMSAKNTSMYCIFQNCSSLEKLNTSGWDASGVTTMAHAFNGCTSLTTVGDTNFNMSAKNTSMYCIFQNCSSLEKLDTSGWDASGVTTMSHAFYGCTSLTTVGDTNFNMSAKNTSMDSIFTDCWSLEKLDTSGWDTSGVTDMQSAFMSCSLTELDTSGWNTGAVQTMRYMFFACRSLTTLDISTWDASECLDMQFMFEWCTSLTNLNMSGFKAEKVQNTYMMFYFVPANVLDLSGWSTANLTNSEKMFAGFGGTTIIVSDAFVVDQITNSENMFQWSGNLVGGAGTRYTAPEGEYDSNGQPWGRDKTYAHIDGGPSNPGYFTSVNGSIAAAAAPLNTDLGNIAYTFYDESQTALIPEQDNMLLLLPNLGESLPEKICVGIEGVEYPIPDDGESGIVYDPVTGLLTIPAYLMTENAVFISISAVPEEVNPIYFDYTALDDHLGWTPLEVMEGEYVPWPNRSYSVRFAPLEGYCLPEYICVSIDENQYQVYTDGLEHREGENLPVMPLFDPVSSTLTIPAELLTEATRLVSMAAQAVEEEPELCALTEGCTLEAGHEGDCVLPESVPCALTQDCTLEAGHEGDCVLPEFVPCALTQDCTLEAGHKGDCILPESVPCALTQGCTLEAGHEGDCVLPEPVPCALTQGCILEAGHEGDCLLPEASESQPPQNYPCKKTEECSLAHGHDGDCAAAEAGPSAAPGTNICRKTAGCTMEDGHGEPCRVTAEETMDGSVSGAPSTEPPATGEETSAQPAAPTEGDGLTPPQPANPQSPESAAAEPASEELPPGEASGREGAT